MNYCFIAVVKRDVWKITVKYLTNRELTWDITEKDGNTAVQLIKYMKVGKGTIFYATCNTAPSRYRRKTLTRHCNGTQHID